MRKTIEGAKSLEAGKPPGKLNLDRSGVEVLLLVMSALLVMKAVLIKGV